MITKMYDYKSEQHEKNIGIIAHINERTTHIHDNNNSCRKDDI